MGQIEVNSISSELRGQEIRHLLLAQSKGLIGREQEIITASALLQRADVRLLVITGPGGVGKTSLALQIANAVGKSFSDGVCCVSLAPIRDASLVIPTISQELGLMEAEEEPFFVRLKTYLRDKRLLLLLDNFEQVAQVAPLLTDILSGCPDLKILVTSRETLHLRIEHEFPVPPLSLPDLKQTLDVSQLTHYAAISLFVQCAKASRPDFQLTPANAHNIAEICTRLDGLPLAIELAAARIRVLPPQVLLAKMDNRLQLLTGGARDLPVRQQTLRDTLTWSYDLLDVEEQLIFRLLSIFVRGCTLEAAEYLCYAIHGRTISVWEVMSSLIDKNLLQRIDQANGDVRVTMLETVREYGQDCLMRCGESEVTCNAHAQYYLTIAEMAAPELRKAQQVKWLDCLEKEYDNLRAAFRWFIGQEKIDAALHLCGALGGFWLLSDHQSEGYQWVEKALAVCKRADVSADIWAKALLVAGVIAYKQGQYLHSVGFLRQSLTLYQELNDHSGIATVLSKLGNAYARNAPSEAHKLYLESLVLAREHHDVLNIIDTLMSLADEAASLTDFARAQTFFTESLALSRAQEDKRSIAYCLAGLGQISVREGNYAEAHVLLRESLTLYREIGDRIGIAFTLIPLGMATLYQGDYQVAQTMLEESSQVSQKLGDRSKIASYLGSLGEVALLSQKGENLPVRALLEESLAIFRGTDNEEGIASKLFALGCMEYMQGAFAAAIQLLEESLALFNRLGNRTLAAAALSMMGHVYAHRGRYKSARAFMEKSLSISREIKDYWTMSYSLSHLGLVALNEGDYPTARSLIEQSLVVAREIGDSRYIAEALSIMGLLSMNEENYESAQVLLKESLELSKQVGDRYFIAYRLADLGLLAIRQRNYTEARPLVEESLNLSIQMNNRWFIASCLERLGEVVIELGQPMWATQLWGAAAALRAAIGAPIPNIERVPYEDAVAVARTRLGEKLFAAMWDAGYATAPEHLIAAPLSEERANARKAQNTGIAAINANALPDGLTPREVEVLRWLALGLTNVQIAERLVISPNTVHAHLSSIYNKLSLSSRSAAMRYAIEHKLS